jgi:hypothetical protein
VPWLQLSTTFSYPLAVSGFSPWMAVFYTGFLHQSVDILTIVGATYIVLFASVVYLSVGLWSMPPDTSITRFPLFFISLLILGTVIFSFVIVPISLMLGYPYYHVMLGIGGWLVVVGLVCIYASSEILVRRQSGR